MQTKTKPRIPNDPLFTVAEIAERDRCSQKTVRRAIAIGYLKAIRVGPGRRSIRITKSAHERYRHLMSS
ncbi:helix-turn-helix domain-containing protein [Halocynthiibacter sp. C4]|uniref:helix-turn-helix domain-containing protein n=1 Tax=Halocynthiibacter sp. C4 TaxID=2992758 RepID=UPI00237A0CEB|nr:helix-turn-helix domain-containing protein [Halocynthiibacter sp. C4]MDE0591580.1 helix-turn-helix domain-containing protein [Halocynthiibacter sp. C4]